MPRYVILEHDWPTRHWDFLLEDGEVLKAWRLLAEPAAGATLAAEASFDHRLLYLDYEGPVSGGRGTVVRWDRGTFAWVERAADQMIVNLFGDRLTGRCTLVRRDGDAWAFQLAADERR
jgi:hypothetical protein